MKKQNEMTETALTVDELKKMGDILGDMRETIELYNHALNLVPDGRNTDPNALAVHYQSLYELTNTMFYKNQKIMKELDHIGHTLSENDDAFEIETTRKKFN